MAPRARRVPLGPKDPRTSPPPAPFSAAPCGRFSQSRASRNCLLGSGRNTCGGVSPACSNVLVNRWRDALGAARFSGGKGCRRRQRRDTKFVCVAIVRSAVRQGAVQHRPFLQLLRSCRLHLSAVRLRHARSLHQRRADKTIDPIKR
jgi:hypothetical protein